MGCIGTKNKNNNNISSPLLKNFPKLHNPALEKSASAKVRIQDAIKKEDIILLEKSLKSYNTNFGENLTSGEVGTTIFHMIAEHNFSAGMQLVLDYFNSSDKNTSKLENLVNFKDSSGHTPLMCCVLRNSFETLEILLQQECVDTSIRNNQGKTASEMASDLDSPLLNLFNTQVSHLKPLLKSPVGSHHLIQNVTPKGSMVKFPKDDDTILEKSNGSSSSKPNSIILRSLASFAKEGPSVDPNKRLHQILLTSKERNTVFSDEEFPHDNFSNIQEAQMDLFAKKYPNVKWTRAHELLGCDINALKVFSQIDLNEVKDSPLYGSDLYSALACLTEYPSRLLKIFTSKDTNKFGVYSVNFLVSGIPLEIVLDDYFPSKKNGKPLYSFSKTQELWFMLLEKAFAKLYGNYFELKHVYISEAIEMMTGMPSTQHPLNEGSEDELWNTMLDHDKKNHIMCAGNYEKPGLVGNRIFTVISLYDSESYRIIKLKNPWEDFSWRIGKYSEVSPNWTSELKQEVGFLQGDKSCFFVSLEEFREQFDLISVCHFHENWIRNRIDTTSRPSQSSYFELTVDREIEIFISVHQKLPKFVNESPDYDVSPVELIVAELLEKDKLVLISSGQKDALIGKPTVYANEKIKMKLSEGKYIVRVKVNWVTGEAHEFTLNTLSSHAIILRDLRVQKYQGFLEKLFLDAGKKNRDKYMFSKDCEFSSGWVGSHLYFYANNAGKSRWTLEINFEKIENLKLGKNFKTSHSSLKFVVPAGKECVSWAKRISNGVAKIKWNFTHEWD